MAFAQTQTILEAARHYHEQLAEYYDLLSKHSQRARVRMVLDYLRLHELHLVTCLADYEDDLPADVQATWYKYPPELPAPVLPANALDNADLNVDRVVELAHEFDTQLLAYYRTAAERAGATKVRALFEDLAKFEEHEDARAMKATFDAY